MEVQAQATQQQVTQDVSSSSDAQANENINLSEVEGDTQDQGQTEQTDIAEIAPEDGHETDFSPEERAQIEKTMKKMNLPKGVSYMLDKKGELKFIVPVNGKKYAVAPQDVFKGFGLMQAGHQKLNEGKNLVGEVQQFFTQMKENPQGLFDLAEKLGHDPYELAEKLLRAKIEEAEMTPEQRKSRADQTEFERVKAENEAYRRKEQDQHFQGLVAQERAKFDTELTEAMVKHGFKKFDTKTKSHILAEAVKNMKFARENKRELNADDAVYLAKQQWQQYTQGVFDDIDDNHIMDLIPERIIKAIRRADISRLQRGDDIPTSTSRAGFDSGQEIENLQEIADTKTGKTKNKKPMSITDYFGKL